MDHDRTTHHRPISVDGRTVLCVWAHPDDEAYLSAGLVIRTLASGGRVHMAYATRGEHGTDDPATWPPERLAALRERELRDALAVMGAEPPEFLGHVDGRCDAVPTATGATQIVELIERHRPDVVVTFGRDGVTGHPDHRAVGRWVVAACRELARRGDSVVVPQILVPAMDREFLDRHRALHEELALFGETGPFETAARDVALRIELTEAELNTKRAVLAAHASQTTGLAARMGEDTYRRWWDIERFRDATPRVERSHRRRALATRGGRVPRGTTELSADVVVVGSRVAGAATAMLLARAGHDVVMLDRISHPSDTLSTSALSRAGVVQLTRWGLLDAVLATGAPPVRHVSFHTSAGARDRVVADVAGADLLMAPRRHHLDPVLVDAAVAAGVRFHEGVTVTGVRHGADGRVVGVDARTEDGRMVVHANHVVGADGVRSTIAREVGATVIDGRPSTAGTHYFYVGGLDATGFEFHVGGGAFAGVFPTHHAQACVFLCAPGSWSTGIRGTRAERADELTRLLSLVSPSLVERIGRASIESPVRGAVGLPNQVRQGSGPGWWLVGDAGYHRDPITGHGITDAFVHAELLVDAIDAQLGGELVDGDARRQYETSRMRALRPTFDVTCALAAFPAEDEFIDLQRHFSDLLEAEACELAARDFSHGRRVAA